MSPKLGGPIAHEYRALFLSDLHLGTRACQAERLLEFLHDHQADRLYLVGDVLDLWRFRSAGLHFPQSHVNVVRSLLGKAKHGTEIVYIPGNHDELLRQFLEVEIQPRLGRIQVLPQTEHLCLDGRRLLVLHGDQHDQYLRLLRNRPLHYLIDKLYGLLTLASLATRPFFPRERNLSQAVRGKLKRVNTFYQQFAEEMRRQAREAGYDGVVCGHVHHPELSQRADSLYLNCGDWVDSCTALGETRDGRFVLLQQRPSPTKKPLPAQPRQLQEAR